MCFIFVYVCFLRGLSSCPAEGYTPSGQEVTLSGDGARLELWGHWQYVCASSNPTLLSKNVTIRWKHTECCSLHIWTKQSGDLIFQGDAWEDTTWDHLARLSPCACLLLAVFMSICLDVALSQLYTCLINLWSLPVPAEFPPAEGIPNESLKTTSSLMLSLWLSATTRSVRSEIA